MSELLNISQMAKLMNMSTSQLRFYEKKGLLKPNRNSISGYREYSFNDIDKLETIHLLKDLSIPIHTIKTIINSDDEIAYQDVLKKSEDELQNEIAYLSRRLELVRKIQENFEYQHSDEIRIYDYDERVATVIESTLVTSASETDLYEYFMRYNLDFMNYDLALIEVFEGNKSSVFCFFDENNPRKVDTDSYIIQKGRYLSKNIKMKDNEERSLVVESFMKECRDLGYKTVSKPFIIDYLESKLYSKFHTFATIQVKIK